MEYTVKVLNKTTDAAISELRSQALKGQTEDRYLSKMVANIITMIKRKPSRYRQYGPYWWAVKDILNRVSGKAEFGDTIDAEWLERMSHGNDVDTLLAAWAYGEVATDKGHGFANEHLMMFQDSDGEETNDYYVLADDEVELINQFL